jgi:DNA-binding SARP family transcriptional activator
MLRIRVLGDLAVEVDGEPRALPPGRAAALLGWLALNPGLHPRVRLAPLFWPEVLDSSARASLRTAVWELRRALGSAGEALAATRDRVGLADGDGLWVDVREVEALRAQGRLEEALDLCSGELLPGVESEWVEGARADHREQMLDLLGRLADAADEAGDTQRAAALSGRAASLDPLSEELHRAWIRRLAGAGDRAAALTAYASFRSRLLATLRVAPSPETERLAQELRESTTATPAGAPTPQGKSGSTPAALPVRLRRAEGSPFVGRDAELERLRAIWGRVLAGVDRPQVVLLAGEPGIGKTRLAARLAADAAAQGAAVLFGSATPDAVVPYEALIEALGDESSAFSAALMSADGEPADVHIARLVAAAAGELRAAALARPVLLVLDDLHAADHGTLAVLSHLVRAPFAERVAFVISSQEPDASDHPLAAAVADLRRECDVVRVRLGGLEEEDVASLVAETAGPSVAAHASSIRDRTGGNPFFVRELARNAVEAGVDEIELDAVPEGVAELVAVRVARLGAAGAEVLSGASVLGIEFDVRLVEEVVAVTPARLLGELERAAGARLVEEAGAGRYRFAHGLIREALYGGLSRSRRARLHGLAAEALERLHPDEGPYLAEIAFHRCDAVDDEARDPAIASAARAAEWANERHAYEQELVLYTRALALLGEDDPRRLTFSVRRAIAYQRLLHIVIDSAARA